ncbi:hypothetical protein D4764_12G0005840 [Takifugu flavidus]|uniref:Uncharacterized protein n=1 Tax=Takifugu flavidus TaxID=433684 RepID=A0A5C6PBM5_9TELE|nr:hypothetical protein D4764_12G0005840 [Takifugu flavidus]
MCQCKLVMEVLICPGCGVEHNWVQLALQFSWRAVPVLCLLEDRSCSPCSLGGLPLPSVSRGTFVLRRTPESSPVQEDCSVLRTHRCSEFPAVQGDCVWFGDSPMDLGRADAASRSPYAEAEGVGEAEAEGEEEAIPVKMISVIIVKIMDTGNVTAERNNVTRDIIEDSSKVLIHLNND